MAKQCWRVFCLRYLWRHLVPEFTLMPHQRPCIQCDGKTFIRPYLHVRVTEYIYDVVTFILEFFRIVLHLGLQGCM